ncbi:MAG: hypothetical protein KJ795_05900 [Gammaproteobacteria bacterium]|nr:hypothetical protein [Gammaproteobacteria bacterium]MBU1775522.1 hypothetical protein [Gammaproteobacteria bacterium]MBU1969515.1 hypothetical protein [Gammaproteobacteria bacterium]
MTESTPKSPGAADYAAVIACAVVPVAVIVWGMGSGNPYGYYVFLRVVVCFSAIVFAALGSGHKRDNLWFLFAAIGVLYNPFIPFHLARGTWLLFNAATIAAFIYGLFFWLAAVRKSRNAA